MIKFHYLDGSGKRHASAEAAVDAELTLTLEVSQGPAIPTKRIAGKLDELGQLRKSISDDLVERVSADIANLTG